jgi:hypothetical protein
VDGKPGRLFVRIGIGNTERSENLGFEPFHGKGLIVGYVVVAEDVEEAMDDEVGEMGLERHALLLRLALQSLAGQRDIADQPLEG